MPCINQGSEHEVIRCQQAPALLAYDALQVKVPHLACEDTLLEIEKPFHLRNVFAIRAGESAWIGKFSR